MDQAVWIIIGLVALFLVFRWWVGYRSPGQVSKMRTAVGSGGSLVDVRTTAEFNGGHADGAINIPLSELTARSRKLNRKKPVVVCCHSGSRSRAAASMLRSAGFGEVFDLGPWKNWRRATN